MSGTIKRGSTSSARWPGVHSSAAYAFCAGMPTATPAEGALSRSSALVRRCPFPASLMLQTLRWFIIHVSRVYIGVFLFLVPWSTKRVALFVSLPKSWLPLAR